MNMILVRFGKWRCRKTDRFVWRRIFWGEFWTPFCWVSKRSRLVRLALSRPHKRTGDGIPNILDIHIEGLKWLLALTESRFSKAAALYETGYIDGVEKMYSIFDDREESK